MFRPEARATLIGSLPLKDHRAATEMIFEYMSDIPLWAQLPCYPEEQLLTQFVPGLPGIKADNGKLYFDTQSTEFEADLLSFFEDYMAVTDGGAPLEGSRFSFSPETERGFLEFLKMAREKQGSFFALKGQVTGPFTMLTGIKDQEGKLAFFNPMLRDAVVKAMALKARYQVEEMKKFTERAILFMDEPALAGFGSSAMVGITRQDATDLLSETVETVRGSGGICGIHVCANTDWPLVLDSGVDILSFDSYSFFDKLILYRHDLEKFLNRGGVLAWGIVPTLDQKRLADEDIQHLFSIWKEQTSQLQMDMTLLRSQAIITPSCGTGLLPLELAEKALALTRDLSIKIRESIH